MSRDAQPDLARTHAPPERAAPARAPALSRRRLLGGLAAAPALWLGGCAAPPKGRPPADPRAGLDPDTRRMLGVASEAYAVVVRGGPGAAVLRRRAARVIRGLGLWGPAVRMERTMRQAQGVGIAGPQVGLSLRVATLMLGYRTDHPRVIFVCNPVILERSDETQEGYEGCLSIPGVGGLVRRNRWVRVRYTTLDGRTVERRDEGPDAVLWQHELDHLEGILYTDRLLGDLLPMDEVRRRRTELEQQQKAGDAGQQKHPATPSLARSDPGVRSLHFTYF